MEALSEQGTEFWKLWIASADEQYVTDKLNTHFVPGDDGSLHRWGPMPRYLRGFMMRRLRENLQSYR